MGSIAALYLFWMQLQSVSNVAIFCLPACFWPKIKFIKLISNHLWMFGLKLFLSVRPFVTKFSQDWYISFSDIVHCDSWPWFLVTDNDRFLGGKNGSLNLGQMRQNWTQNHVFFCSLVFLPMTCNDSLEQCLTSSGGKIHDKKI